jgi:hypothetical protein
VQLLEALHIRATRALRSFRFPGSAAYWDERYKAGGNSGPGSFGESALYKATFVNAFVKDSDIASVVEHGCGDGNQLALAEYPDYVGLDVSPEAIKLCRERFTDDRTKRFELAHDGVSAELALSLDVIFHLVEEEVFEEYMRRLFASATRFVLIYAPDADERNVWPMYRSRRFTDYVEERAGAWRLREHVESAQFLDFFVYGQRPEAESP